MIRNKIRSIFNPEQFQVWTQKRSFFEGWYFKVVNETESKAFAFIPVSAMDKQGNRHAFIQVLDSKKQTALYYKFEVELFIPAPDSFNVAIGENHFSRHAIQLNLPGLKGIFT